MKLDKKVAVININDEPVVDSGICGSDITWTLHTDGTLNIKGTGKMEDFEHITDVPWYNYRSSIKKVIIKAGVISIGSMVFDACTEMTYIDIPNTITEIGDGAFADCSKLVDVIIPNSVKYMGKCAFYACSSIESITIPQSISRLRYRTFAYCESLKNITIENNNAYIGYEVFYGCDSLENEAHRKSKQ